MKRSLKSALFFIISVFNIYFFIRNLKHYSKKTPEFDVSIKSNVILRDFFRYKCQNLRRIGGLMKFIEKVPHDLYR